MKSYYCFIRETGLPRPDSFVYHVGVGTSERDQTKLALVQEYSKDCGLYFKKWSSQVDTSLEFAMCKFKPVRGRWSRPFLHARISIAQLYQMIVDDSFVEYEAKMKNNLWPVYRPTIMMRNPAANHPNQISNTVCQASQSQNLSFGKLSEGVQAAICFWFILGLLFLDAYLSPVIENLFR